MRIVAGAARGRTLATPKKADTIRPTADRTRETLFNVLGQWCEGLQVLDLYAGTGALGLEAVSRGATRAVLVDRDREALELCRLNTETCGFGAQVEIVASPVEKVWARLRGRQFQLVFADPPYKLESGRATLEALEAHGLLGPGATVVFEHGKAEVLPAEVGRLTRVDERAFGDTRVSIYRFAGA
jgi:16S rRNA (guanine(966)-N(2))-methyltransferase RsmD